MRICEINTFAWLADLSERHRRRVTLATVPTEEWSALLPYHFDAVWLLGVWQRSPVSREIAQSHEGVAKSCAEVVPGFNRDRDVVGSPFAVRAYSVDEQLGGRDALAEARRQLSRRSMKLILDFVPNHTARDHSWITSHPEYYVRASEREPTRAPSGYFRTDRHVFAFGNGEWTDTAQLDALNDGYRRAAISTLLEIAEQCDGVRCDMAHLMRTDTFAARWASPHGPKPREEFWRQVISSVRVRHPKLVFIAESYSGSEWALQQEGFDYAYDKDKLYDRLRTGTAEQVRQHLESSSLAYLRHLVHFIENHDEVPATEAFQPQARHWLSALAVATLPGATLWHYLQFDGRWGKQVVQLGVPVSVGRFYRRLLEATNRPAILEGTWALCPVSGSSSLLAWCWEKGEDRVLVVINMASVPPGQKHWGYIAVPWADLKGRTWTLRDEFSGDRWLRSGDEMFEGGLHVGLPSWGMHLFDVTTG